MSSWHLPFRFEEPSINPILKLISNGSISRIRGRWRWWVGRLNYLGNWCDLGVPVRWDQAVMEKATSNRLKVQKSGLNKADLKILSGGMEFDWFCSQGISRKWMNEMRSVEIFSPQSCPIPYLLWWTSSKQIMMLDNNIQPKCVLDVPSHQRKYSNSTKEPSWGLDEASLHHIPPPPPLSQTYHYAFQGGT